ncbi:MAG: radical SAM protein [Acidobacteria bacterium]|nr:radical SAM protein [Acidobacteriota bacterium]
MNLPERVVRHIRLTARNYAGPNPPSPPFLILFINSICNQTCEHCFYWRNLNRKDDLTVEEMRQLSEDLGPIENLNLSGGEPFLRKEFGEICRFFISNNGVKQIYVPTNGSSTERTVAAIEEVCSEPDLHLFVVELSLDGMPEFHDHFRGMKNAFERSMRTYGALAELQEREPRLRIHAISTVTSANLDQIRELTRYLYERCPALEHHNLALIRGDRKNPSLQGPQLAEYCKLYQSMQQLWAPRERDRYGAIMEPMLQWAKTRTAEERRQVIPCRAGILSGVVYSNGDVSLCETHPPLGNLRQKPFMQIWHSEEAARLRRSIAAKECYCTNEVFLWPSINYQPLHLAKTLLGARAWEKTRVS